MNLHLSGCTHWEEERLTHDQASDSQHDAEWECVCVCVCVCRGGSERGPLWPQGYFPMSTLILWCHAAAGKWDMAHARRTCHWFWACFGGWGVGGGRVTLRGWDRNSSALPSWLLGLRQPDREGHPGGEEQPSPCISQSSAHTCCLISSICLFPPK